MFVLCLLSKDNSKEHIKKKGRIQKYKIDQRKKQDEEKNPDGGRVFPHPFRPSVGPTLPPVRWIPGFSRG
jgi:hypothetical protein